MKPKIEEKFKKKAFRKEYVIHENLLQAYRNFFISIQSFMIAVGALLMSIELPLYIWLVVPIIAGLIIWVLWFPAVRVKIFLVDFYKFSLHDEILDQVKNTGFTMSNKMARYQKHHKGYQLKPMDYYVHDKPLRKGVNRKNCIDTWRGTRLRVDVLLPVSFSIIWLTLIYSKIFFF